MTERNRYQSEMSKRATDVLPFHDNRLAKEVAKAVLAEAKRVKTMSGEVPCPFSISPRERGIILSKLPSLRGRVYFVSGIRMAEGEGTLIQIDRIGKIYGKK